VFVTRQQHACLLVAQVRTPEGEACNFHCSVFGGVKGCPDALVSVFEPVVLRRYGSCLVSALACTLDGDGAAHSATTTHSSICLTPLSLLSTEPVAGRHQSIASPGWNNLGSSVSAVSGFSKKGPDQRR
jgi:hypothetical protein